MKKFILVLISIISLNTWAQFVTPGNFSNYTLDDLVDLSGGAVTFGSDHYFFNEDITISANDTLSIVNDEYLQIGEGLLWTIEGVLILDAPNMTFVSNVSGEGKFLGIRFDQSSASLVRNASIVNAGGIRLLESDMVFENCSFGNFDTEYSTGALNLYQSNPHILSCSFTNNEGPAIASGANAASSPQIINCVINENVTGNGNTPQINLGTSDGLTPIVIDSNHIYGMYDNAGGIAIATLAGGNITAFIRYNEVSFNRYGIAVIGNNLSGQISNNFIEGNNIQNNPMLGGSGINFQGESSNNMIVHHNVIVDNLWGITIQNNAQPNLGDESGFSPGHNQIYNNGNNGETYALYNNTPGDIMAMNNFWGTATLAETEDVIYHVADDLSLGEVFYDPIWLPVGIDEVANETNISPNPAQNYFLWNSTDAQIQIYNLSGQVFWDGEIKAQQKMDVSSWESGIYLIRNENNNTATKLVIE